MRTLCRAALSVGLIAFSACATAPSGPLREGELRVTKLTVPNPAPAGPRYPAVFEGVERGSTDIRVVRACLTWQTMQFTDWPYCFAGQEDTTAKTFTVHPSTRNPNNYTLYGYLEYEAKGRTKQSNTVRGSLVVR